MKQKLPCKTFGSATSSQLSVKLQLYFANHFLQPIWGKSLAKENDLKFLHKVDGNKGTPQKYGFDGFFKLVNGKTAKRQTANGQIIVVHPTGRDVSFRSTRLGPSLKSSCFRRWAIRTSRRAQLTQARMQIGHQIREVGR